MGKKSKGVGLGFTPKKGRCDMFGGVYIHVVHFIYWLIKNCNMNESIFPPRKLIRMNKQNGLFRI